MIDTSNLERIGKRTTWILLLAQSMASAASILAFTVGAIVVVDLAGGASGWTGIPSTLTRVGAALAAFPAGQLMGRFGRRMGLSLGYAVGAIGMLLAGIAVLNGWLILFLIGFFLIGMARGVTDQGRYAAAEANPAHRRGRAISLVVLGGTVGSIVGPTLIAVSSSVGTRMNLPETGGAWFAGAFLLVVGLVLVTAFLHPDPLRIARQLETQQTLPRESDSPAEEGRTFSELLRDPRMRLAIAAMVFGQLTMTVIMVITPFYMRSHQHAMGEISAVIMAHTMGMFGLSFVTGWLVDKFGPVRIVVGGSVLLVLAGLTAPFASTTTLLAVSLFMLGLGWNFCYVSGTALLEGVLRPGEKGRVQGAVDSLIGITAGTGSFSSGLVYSSIGFSLTSWAMIVVALLPALFTLGVRAIQGGPPPEVSTP